MITVAQTNIQLYNELRARETPLEELLVVHRAYELLTTLYTGRFQADGKPFVAHGVGVASILARLDQPAEILALGLLHNVYDNADFGDGQGSGPTPGRRALVREAAGDRVEQLVSRFVGWRAQTLPVSATAAELSRRDDTERRLILVDLADYLEKHLDLGALYQQGELGRELTRGESKMLELSRALEPRLAEWLSAALDETAEQRKSVPAALSPTDRRDYSTLVVPRSYRRRTWVTLRVLVRSLRDRTQLRTRLRRFLAS